MKKLLHFFGLETREEIMEFKQRRAQKPFLMLIKRIDELENRIKELENQTFKKTKNEDNVRDFRERNSLED